MEFIQVNNTTIYYNHFFYEDTVIDGTHGYRVFASVDANGKADIDFSSLAFEKEINGKKVISMDKCFQDIKEITLYSGIPEGASILSANECFKGCVNLHKIPKFPDTVRYMNSAFENCKRLFQFQRGNIVLPASLREANNLFKGCVFSRELALTFPKNLVSADKMFSLLKSSYLGNFKPNDALKSFSCQVLKGRDIFLIVKDEDAVILKRQMVEDIDSEAERYFQMKSQEKVIKPLTGKSIYEIENKTTPEFFTPLTKEFKSHKESISFLCSLFLLLSDDEPLSFIERKMKSIKVKNVDSDVIQYLTSASRSFSS